MSIGMSDTILYDRSRFRNNGTFSNVTWVQLPSGLWVMQFNGTTSYVEIADSPSMRMTRGGTIVAWIKANSAGENTLGRIIDKSSADNGTNGYGLGFHTNTRLYFVVNAGTATFSTASAVGTGIYKMVAVTFSGAGRKFYINAVEDMGGSGKTETALPPDISGAVRIGNRVTTTDRTFDGQIALPRIYNRVFTQTEITRIFNSQRGLFGV